MTIQHRGSRHLRPVAVTTVYSLGTVGSSFLQFTSCRGGSGNRNSWYCVLDEAGQKQLEQRVRTSAKALREVFSTMPRNRIALETGRTHLNQPLAH